MNICFLQFLELNFVLKSAAITFLNAFMHSRIDYCDSLLYGLPKYSLHRLQKLQKLCCSYFYMYLSFVTHYSYSHIFTLVFC